MNAKTEKYRGQKYLYKASNMSNLLNVLYTTKQYAKIAYTSKINLSYFYYCNPIILYYLITLIQTHRGEP